MIERNFLFSDVHFPEHDEKAVDCAIKIMSDYKPHRIILMGDFLDMTPVSHWLKDKQRVLENKRLLKDYEGANKLLDHIVSKAGKQLKEVIYIRGNHEEWLEMYIDKHPEIEGLLELEENIKLSNKKISLQFVEMNKFYKIGKLYVTHGLYTNKYHAAKTLENVGKSVIYGHTHSIQMMSKAGMIDDDKHISMSIGCLCNKSPSYMKNRPHSWIHAIATVDVLTNGNFTPHVIPIYDGAATYNGKIYKSGKR